MNQQDLIYTLQDQFNADCVGRGQLTAASVKTILRTLGEVVGAELNNGDSVNLPGLGILSVKERAARTGRNPKTGEAIEIPARRVVKFSPAKGLRDLLN